MSYSILFCLSLILATLSGCDSSTVSFSNPVSVAASGPEVKLAWSASSGSPQGYQVAQSTDNVNFTIVQTVSAPAATITGLTAGETYYFEVRAYNQGGNSAYTSSVSAAIPVPSATPTSE